MKDEHTMPRHELPDNDAWIARFKAFKAWVDANGRLPENDPEGGPEDTLRTWLERQRTDIQNGMLSPNLERIIRSVSGAIPRAPRKKAVPDDAFPPGNGRLDNLELFYKRYGRLPRYSGNAPGEKSMYKYLNGVVRVRFRRDELEPATVERLEKIPGVFTARKFTRRDGTHEKPKTPTARALRIQAADTRMADLIEYCTKFSRLPSATGPGNEPSLYNYLRKVVRPAYQAGNLDEVTVKRLSVIEGVLVPRGRWPKSEKAAA